MNTPQDPQEFDAGWLATDAIGQVALFTTAGVGPIPDSALLSIDSAEDSVLSLPEVTDVELISAVPRPDDFVAFAKRGVFSYDWSDVHRTSHQVLGGYELQCRPLNPLTLHELPEPLRAMAQATRIPDATFGASMVLSIDLVVT